MFPQPLNPFQTAIYPTNLVQQAIFADLFRYDTGGKVVPQVATAVPTLHNGGIRDGGKTVVIHFRHGFKWSNGTPVTSADLKFMWRIEVDPASGPACKGSCDGIRRIDLPDRSTAVLHLKRPLARDIVEMLPGGDTGIPDQYGPQLMIPAWKGAWKKGHAHAAALQLFQNPHFTFETSRYPTNGPYRVQQFSRDLQDARIVVTRAPSYPRTSCEAPPWQIIFRWYPSKDALIAAAAKGEVDLGSPFSALLDLPTLEGAGHRFGIRIQPRSVLWHFELNHARTVGGKPNPLSNVKVRQALALAADRRGMIEGTLRVDAATAGQLEAPSFLLHTVSRRSPDADPAITGQWDPVAGRYVEPGTDAAIADARKLLSSTPYATGFELDLLLTGPAPVHKREVAMLVQDWSRLGVQVRIQEVPEQCPTFSCVWWPQLSPSLFNAILATYTAGPDPMTFKRGQVCDPHPPPVPTSWQLPDADFFNYSAICDSVIDRAYGQASRTADDPAQRTSLYRLIERRMNRQAHWLPLYYLSDVWTDSGRVRHFTGSFWNVADWTVMRE